MTSESICWANVFSVWWRNFFMFMKNWRSGFIPNFFQPLIYLLGMGTGMGFYISQMNGMSYMEFIAPGLIAVTAMNGATFEATYNVYVKLVYDKIYDQMIATPLNEREILLAEILWAMTRALIYGLMFLLVAAFFGLVKSGWAIGLMLVLPLTGYFFATIGIAFGMMISTIDVFSYYYNLFLVPLFVFSDVFFSIRERWGEWGVRIANCTPLYHAVKLSRASMQGQWDSSLWGSIAYLAVIGGILHVIGSRLFVRRLHRSVK